MPRPKRTRGVATRQANLGAETSAPTSATQPAAHNPIIPSGSSTDIYDLSDREKEKIRTQNADDTALQSARPRLGVKGNAQQAKALEDSMRRRDEAMTRLDDLTSTSKTFNASSDDVESPPEIGRRSQTSLRQGRPTDVSGLDLDDDMFGDLDDSLVGHDQSQSVHHSTDTSSLNVAAFRKRPRKSSIVGRDDAPIRPSSRGPNTPGISSTLNFGHFRRRPREPSILGTGRRGRSNSRQPQASGDESENERDLTRNIGLTPLRQTSRQPGGAPSSEAPRQASPNERTRKRKSLEDHGSGQKRAALDSDDDVRDSIEVDDNPDASRRGRSPPRLATPDMDDPDLAPPLSSGSSEGGAAIWPPLDSLAHRTYRTRRPASRALKTPELGDSGSDISSPPSLTHSPNYRPAAKTKRNVRAAKAKVTTADLASLLPRRRHKKTGSNPFEITSSDAEEEDSTLGNEDDELAYTSSRATRTRKTPRPPGREANSEAKDKRAAGTAKTSRRTYGSRSSDKENQGEEEIIVGAGDDAAEDEGEEDGVELPDEETSQMMLVRLGQELKSAAKKFKEVDKWELEFEEITHSSSPKDAR